MKKYIIAVLLTFTLSINVFAQSSSVAEQIATLRAQITELQAEINRLLGVGRPVFCYEFRENFVPGSGHPDWTKLGEVLRLEGVSSVKELQEKYEADMLRPAGLRLGTGYVGPLTRTKLNQIYRCPVSGNLPPTISGITGPTVLTVGQTGTWTINASDPENGSLNYSVHWGDEPIGATETGASPSAERVYNQTATLTHTYSRAGTYYPKFWVRDNANNNQWTSLSVTVSASNSARITVTSPNGGESWVANSVETIKWSTVNTKRNDKVDIYLRDKFFSNCTGICPAVPTLSGVVLDKNIPVNSTYNWIVGTDINNNPISADRYIMQVCLTGTNICDQSDLGFDITNSTTEKITVISPDGGERWEVNETEPITWRINDQNVRRVDLYLEQLYECNSTPGTSCAALYSSEEVLDKNINANATYNWIVATDINNDPIPSAPRNYLVVCPAGSHDSGDQDCDRSNQPFSIVNNSLVYITYSGGFCAAPGCLHPIISIDQNGNWNYVTTSGLREGRLSSSELRELKDEIVEADFDDIRSDRAVHCPSIADGVDVTYTFKFSNINETLSNCTFDIPADHPLFVLLSEIISDIRN